tara:strand:- start:2791 stop:3432 length:642 start_codon:yes stop_codon:yes gene_type:complete
MIIQNVGVAKTVSLHDNADNIDSAEIIRVAHIKQQHTSDTIVRFLQVVSSDFALPSLSARTTSTIAKGNTTAKGYDNLTTGGDAFTTGLQVHGGGFGLTFGTTAVISVLADYTGNSDDAATLTIGASAGGSATAYPEEVSNNSRLFFGTLTGSVKAVYTIPPASVTYIKKSATDKVFVTPGVFATSGSGSFNSNVRVEKVTDIRSMEVNIRKR